MNPNQVKCANCKFWKEDGLYDNNPNKDFNVYVGRCSKRNDSYTDEFYKCLEFEHKEE